MVANSPIKTPSDGHPEAYVDLEITKIVSQNLAAPDGQGAAKIVAGVTPEDVDQEERSDV
jgi:hypothetical protein